MHGPRSDDASRTTRSLEELAPTAELDPLRHRFPDGRTLVGPTRRRLWAAAIRLAPGLGLVALLVVAAAAIAEMLPGVSSLVVAVALGATLANVGSVPVRAVDGLHFAAKRLLRAGVVLLGFQLVATEILHLGAPAIAAIVLTVVVTFFGTRWLGARLGLSAGLSLLVATGFSICGASAIAAVDGVADADEEDVAYSVALVTLCGSLAIVLLPLLREPLGLESSVAFGSWVGASVHDVGQVVATASTGGSVVLAVAVVVKLSRVVLLAPIVAGVGVSRRRRSPTGPEVDRVQVPLVPLFVVGFLCAMTLRSAAIVPTGWLEGIEVAQDLLLTAALVGLGTGVRIDRLRRVGARPFLLGAGSWVLVASVAHLGVTLAH